MTTFRISVTSTIDRVYEIDAEDKQNAEARYLTEGHLTAETDAPDEIDWIAELDPNGMEKE